MVKAFTDYPFEWLGDEVYKKAPVREIEIIGYDGNKYCRVKVEDGEDEVKSGYVYHTAGRYGDVKSFTHSELASFFGLSVK